MLASLVLFAWRVDRRRVLEPASLRFVQWETLVLLGGGFSLAACIQASGLSHWLGAQLEALRAAPPFAQAVAASLVTVALSAFASNAATTAVMLPVLAEQRRARARDRDPVRGDVLGLVRLRAAGRHAAQRDRVRLGLSHDPADGAHRGGARRARRAVRGGLVLVCRATPSILRGRRGTLMRALRRLGWVAAALAGAGALAVIATARGEPISSAWFLIAAVCIYALGFRFYSGFLARRVFALDDARATPAHRLRDGKDYVPTHRWVVFGHHFAAIAGPGPLVGPILAAQFGYLPGTLYILIGVVIGGAVQDFTILVGSLRRNGKSLGQMVREEIGPLGGAAALVGVLAIMVILIGVLGLVVVNAMFGSPWATSTVAATIPIAIAMGLYMTLLRPGRVLEATLIGLAFVMLAVFAGRWIDESAALRVFFDLDKKTLALCLIGYGFTASVLPVWLLLAPRDYLSAFIKIGTVAMLAAGLLVRAPARAAARAHAVHRRQRARVRGQAVPVLLHHDRVRRDLGLPRADLERHDAEAARPRERRARGRLRRDADGELRRDHGAALGGGDGPRRLLRDQLARGADRHHGRERRDHDLGLGLCAGARRARRRSRTRSASTRCSRARAARRASRWAWRRSSRRRSAAMR